MANDTKFPTEVVELPSKGYFYPKDSPLASGKVEMKYMTAREEDILTSPNLMQQGTMINVFLKALIIDKSIDVDEFLIGDKNGLIVASRILGYGKDYDFEYTTESGDVFTSIVDLTTIQEKQIDFSKFKKGQTEFPYTLPNSERVLTFQLMTQKAEFKVEREIIALEKISDGISYEITTRLKHFILSVDGKTEKEYINSFVDNEFLSRDALDFRRYISSITPDVDMTTTVTGKDGIEREVAVPITAQFFWPKA